MLAAVLACLVPFGFAEQEWPCLAPTPKPVERLTPELVPGLWDCRWGSTAAWFAFHADGTYLYGVSECASHVGRWEVRGGVLRLVERPVHGGGLEQAYDVGPLDVTRYPTVSGTVGDSHGVVLSNPRRFEE